MMSARSTAVRFAVQLLLAGFFWHLSAGATIGGRVTEIAIPTEVGADADLQLLLAGGAGVEGGFIPARMRIVNRADGERQWELAATVTGYGSRSPTSVRSQHEFIVPGGTTRDFFIFLPTPHNDAHSVVLEADVTGPAVAGTPRNVNVANRAHGTYASVAVQTELEEAFRHAAFVHLPTYAPPRGVRGRVFHPAVPPSMERMGVIDPRAWPADWRVWSSYEVVLLEQGYWESLGTPYRRALLDWVAQGGRLCLSPSARGEASAKRHGLGEIVTLSGPMSDADASDFNGVALAERATSLDLAANAGSYLRELDEKAWRHAPPARWVALFLVGFGILVGPVNLFYFAPAGRRHRLFLTVPAISVATAVLLGALILFRDGLGGEGARQALVVLLPEEHQAVVLQRQVARTGMLPGRSFDFPADAVILRQDGTSGAAGMVRTQNRASGDWFASRSTQTHLVWRLVPTRERVELLSGPADAPVVQSTVTPALRKFVYRDAAGKLFFAEEVAPGARVTLQPLEWGPASAFPLSFLPPAGTYRAAGTTSEVAPIATLSSIDWKDSVLYIGTLQPPSTP